MDQKELLAIVGDLYIKNYILTQEISKKDKEIEELKGIIISLKPNGNISS